MIRGTAVNNDGRSSGSAKKPSRAGQEAVLREAHRNAGVSGADIQYMEAHGTGTPVGDPVEMGALATRTRSVVAANFSVGVTVLTELVTLAARLLDRSFEPEIVELHHHSKKDAPSGTALALARAIATTRRIDFDDAARLAREGLVGERPRDEIGIVALRAGDAVGDHTVVFGGLGERVELIHRAQSRECLARGALRAARWVADQRPGLYSMRDVLGLRADS